MKHHIILFTCGIDSTAILIDLLFEKKIPKTSITLLQFEIPSKQNKQEIKRADRLLDLNQFKNIEHMVIELPLSLGLSILKTGKGLGVKATEQAMQNITVPFRNAVLISAAVNQLSGEIKKGIVYHGAHEDDVKFPDCTKEFFKGMRQAVKFGTAAQFELKTPFLNKSKEAIVKIYKKHKQEVVAEHFTYSCYKGNRLPCHNCMTCYIRDEALEKMHNESI